jgi:pantoate--beta-alanine ligase
LRSLRPLSTNVATSAVGVGLLSGCFPGGLSSAAAEYDQGERNAERLIEAVKSTVAAEPLTRIDYVSVNDAETLEQLDELSDRPALISAAVFIGKTRLIDNIVLGNAKKQDASGAGA